MTPEQLALAKAITTELPWVALSASEEAWDKATTGIFEKLREAGFEFRKVDSGADNDARQRQVEAHIVLDSFVGAEDEPRAGREHIDPPG